MKAVMSSLNASSSTAAKKFKPAFRMTNASMLLIIAPMEVMTKALTLPRVLLRQKREAMIR